jgi:hypothetical protein
MPRVLHLPDEQDKTENPNLFVAVFARLISWARFV